LSRGTDAQFDLIVTDYAMPGMTGLELATKSQALEAHPRPKGPPPLEDIVNLEDEALAETGNIILNSWVATIANLLKSGLKMSLPTVVRGDSSQMFKSDESQSLVLFLHIKFEISTKEIRGYVALIMDIPSVEGLRALIADFIANATRTNRS